MRFALILVAALSATTALSTSIASAHGTSQCGGQRLEGSMIFKFDCTNANEADLLKRNPTYKVIDRQPIVDNMHRQIGWYITLTQSVKTASNH